MIPEYTWRKKKTKRNLHILFSLSLLDVNRRHLHLISLIRGVFGLLCHKSNCDSIALNAQNQYFECVCGDCYIQPCLEPFERLKSEYKMEIAAIWSGDLWNFDGFIFFHCSLWFYRFYVVLGSVVRSSLLHKNRFVVAVLLFQSLFTRWLFPFNCFKCTVASSIYLLPVNVIVIVFLVMCATHASTESSFNLFQYFFFLISGFWLEFDTKNWNKIEKSLKLVTTKCTWNVFLLCFVLRDKKKHEKQKQKKNETPIRLDVLGMHTQSDMKPYRKIDDLFNIQ